MRRLTVPLTATLLLAAGGLTAAYAVQTDAEPRVSRLIVYGSDPCPRGAGEEIVICARRAEDDRYRVPEALREDPQDPEGESWAARARSLEFVGRTGIQSCSTVGPGGFTGCWAEMIRQAREERAVNPEGQPVP